MIALEPQVTSIQENKSNITREVVRGGKRRCISLLAEVHEVTHTLSRKALLSNTYTPDTQDARVYRCCTSEGHKTTCPGNAVPFKCIMLPDNSSYGSAVMPIAP